MTRYVNISGETLDMPTLGYRVAPGRVVEADPGAMQGQVAFREAAPGEGEPAERLTPEQWAARSPRLYDERLAQALFWQWARGEAGAEVLTLRCPEGHRIGRAISTTSGYLLVANGTEVEDTRPVATAALIQHDQSGHVSCPHRRCNRVYEVAMAEVRRAAASGTTLRLSRVSGGDPTDSGVA